MSRALIPCVHRLSRDAGRLLCRSEGSAILEFAVALPLLVVFVVGIYDFSGAFNDRQKIEQAAQEGAIVAGGQPTNDIQPGSSAYSLLPVVNAVFNSLVASGVLLGGTTCTPPGTPIGPVSGLTWTYTISGCPYTLTITINRGLVVPSGGSTGTAPDAVGTVVTVSYPYHWQFNSVIPLIGGSISLPSMLTESATVHNQL